MNSIKLLISYGKLCGIDVNTSEKLHKLDFIGAVHLAKFQPPKNTAKSLKHMAISYDKLWIY